MKNEQCGVVRVFIDQQPGEVYSTRGVSHHKPLGGEIKSEAFPSPPPKKKTTTTKQTKLNAMKSGVPYYSRWREITRGGMKVPRLEQRLQSFSSSVFSASSSDMSWV